MENSDCTENLAGMALAFGLVARALHAYDDRLWLQSLTEEDVFAETPFGAGHPSVEEGLGHLQRWTAECRDGVTDDVYEALRVDHTRLFVASGPDFVPPWESVYFNPDRLVFQKETLEVREWYRRFGVESRHLHHEPDDHIALEMAFLAMLAERAHTSAAEGGDSERQRLTDAMRDFLSQHLLRWAPACLERLAHHARTDFYRGIALLGRGFLAEAAAQLGLQNEG